MNADGTVRKPELVCRPAQPSDTPAALELCSHIWDGGDYVPRVWEDWLADPIGLLAVGELEGQVLCLGKLTLLSPGSWWLEGLRVHPDSEGKGFGSKIFEYLTQYWIEHGDGTLRLVTYSLNRRVHRMCARMGYEKIGEISPYRAPGMEQDESLPFTTISKNEVSGAVARAKSLSSLEYSRGLIDLGWTWDQVHGSHLVKAAEDGKLWRWRDDLGIIGAWDEVDDGETALYLMLAGCPQPLLPKLLADVRRLGAHLGYSWVGWNAPQHPEVCAALEQAGYHAHWEEGSLFIFERRRR